MRGQKPLLRINLRAQPIYKSSQSSKEAMANSSQSRLLDEIFAMLSLYDITLRQLFRHAIQNDKNRLIKVFTR